MITKSGIALAVAAVLLGVAGTVADYPELIILALASALALLFAVGWMAISPHVVIFREIHPARVVEGESARGVVAVTNAARRRSPPIVASDAVGTRTVSITLPSLAPGGRFEAAYPLPTDRRGVFEVGPLTIGHSDPLRLMHIARIFPVRSTLRVHPRTHQIAPLPTGGSPDMDGPTSSAAPQGGVAFHSLREYVRGDDLRLIHWRSTARTGRFMVRHNVVPNEPRMMIVLDTSAAPYDKDFFEDGVRVAASLAVSACGRGFPVELRTTAGQRVTGGLRTRSSQAILDMLAGVQNHPDDPGLSALLGFVPREEGVALGIVTGQAPASAIATVSAVRPRFAMVSLVQVGEEHGRPGPALREALVVNVRTSDEFARTWNARVQR